jgi:hypothetical protein
MIEYAIILQIDNTNHTFNNMSRKLILLFGTVQIKSITKKMMSTV